ncbi:MAG: hypothetical protein QM755_00755 [Luteolibacter sp.]
MKRIALSLAAAAMAFFGATPQAEARYYGGPSTYVSSYARCGCPIYVQRYIAFYDGWGRPIWRTRVLPIQHRCGGSRIYYRGGYTYTPYRGGFTYGGYGYHRPGR